jgi:hypothetical protein
LRDSTVIGRQAAQLVGGGAVFRGEELAGAISDRAILQGEDQGSADTDCRDDGEATEDFAGEAYDAGRIGPEPEWITWVGRGRHSGV